MTVVSAMPRAIKSTFWEPAGRDLTAIPAANLRKGIERSLSANGYSRSRARAIMKGLGISDSAPEPEFNETDLAALIAGLRA